MNTFLPENYTLPKTGGNYFKFQDGENNFRILSSAIIGYEYWDNNNKPIRSEKPFKETPNIRLDADGNPTKIKHFWAFIVYNYDVKAIQLMEITQKSVMSAIKALVENTKWGDPKKYDITITKTGEKLTTEYSVMPNPHSDLDISILEAYSKKSINLQALYKGDDPFSNGDKEMKLEDF